MFTPIWSIHLSYHDTNKFMKTTVSLILKPQTGSNIACEIRTLTNICKEIGKFLYLNSYLIFKRYRTLY